MTVKMRSQLTAYSCDVFCFLVNFTCILLAINFECLYMDRMNSDYIKEKCDKHMIVSLLPNLLKKLVGNRLL